MPITTLNTTPKTYNLIEAIVGPLGRALEAVYNTPTGKPEIQKIAGHFASIGPALILLLDQPFLDELSSEWHRQLVDAIGTAVTGAVPLVVDGAKLIIHFAAPKKQ